MYSVCGRRQAQFRIQRVSESEGRRNDSSVRSYIRGRMPRRDVAGYTHLSFRFAHWLRTKAVSLRTINVPMSSYSLAGPVD